MTPQPTRPLGRTGIDVTALSLGAAPIGNFHRAMSGADATAVVDAAVDTGVRLFDTAPVYGLGLSEHRLGHALFDRPADSRVLVTKVGRLLRPTHDRGRDTGLWIDAAPFDPVYDYSYDGVMRSIDDSLNRLLVDRVDVALVHDVDVFTHGRDAQPGYFKQAVDDGYRALVRLKDEGVVGAIGFGVNEADVCVEAMRRVDVDCFLLAGRYTLLEQSPLDELFPLCVDNGVGVILGGVFNSGILAAKTPSTGRFNYGPAPADVRSRAEQLADLCARHGVPLAAAALQFSAAHPAVSTVCVGASSPQQVRQNADLLDVAIPAALWQELLENGLIRADAPTP